MVAACVSGAEDRVETTRREKIRYREKYLADVASVQHSANNLHARLNNHGATMAARELRLETRSPESSGQGKEQMRRIADAFVRRLRY